MSEGSNPESSCDDVIEILKSLLLANDMKEPLWLIEGLMAQGRFP